MGAQGSELEFGGKSGLELCCSDAGEVVERLHKRVMDGGKAKGGFPMMQGIVSNGTRRYCPISSKGLNRRDQGTYASYS